MATKISSNVPEAVNIDVEGIIENSFPVGEEELSEERERRIIARTLIDIRLFRRSGNVEKVLRKPKPILEQDLVKHEGENEGSWVLSAEASPWQSATSSYY